jgi:hypothetical protein
LTPLSGEELDPAIRSRPVLELRSKHWIPDRQVDGGDLGKREGLEDQNQSFNEIRDDSVRSA